MSKHTVIVVALVHESGKILLVKQAYGYHLWTLPGGRVEAGETLVGAACREVSEESGLETEPDGLLGVRDKAGQTVFVFSLRVTGGSLLESIPGEIEAVRWFDREAFETERGEVEQFPAYVLERFFRGELTALPLSPWDGYTGPADLFI